MRDFTKKLDDAAGAPLRKPHTVVDLAARTAVAATRMMETTAILINSRTGAAGCAQRLSR